LRIAGEGLGMSRREWDELKSRTRVHPTFRGRTIGYEGYRFVAYFYFVGWDCISLGLHLCWSLPNVEMHLPFGFIRIGINPVSKARPA
jgi:hypothetical protein